MEMSETVPPGDAVYQPVQDCEDVAQIEREIFPPASYDELLPAALVERSPKADPELVDHAVSLEAAFDKHNGGLCCSYLRPPSHSHAHSPSL